jgi:hypothetical protein
MVEFTRRATSGKRGTMSAGHESRPPIACPLETKLKLHDDLPKAKTPQEQESFQCPIVATDKDLDALGYELHIH